MGLVQREIEAAGFTTIALSNIPDLTASVSVPRLAAIEHPFGLTIGQPFDREGQMAVIRAVLQALKDMTTPGSVIHLPFAWSSLMSKAQLRPPQAPPISRYLIRHPWLYPKLLSRDIPQEVE